ncbi:hypothetical protein [Parabacteroides hominis]|uniref:Uncharacterized protein n=1 Tax=Parabacteroides hominis TaxID=2763057 RepID=A0ABR7DL59_9BACT|nr:hypothetical protein [Parabacteroides hominis]MBC5632145.1 hypothetical protein [Parabacteroides hominis]
MGQQTFRSLTAVSTLNAHQLRPEIEPDGSLGMADTTCFFAIQVRRASCRRFLLPSASADGQVIASGLAGSSVGFNPFKYNLMKGTKVHRGRGFASKSFKPSASADGKRERAA